MRALRRFLQFLFLLQGIELLILVPGILFMREAADPELHPYTADTARQEILGMAVAIIPNLIAAIAWWKLRRRTPSARWWALAASFLALPIPLPGLRDVTNIFARPWSTFALIFHFPPEVLEAAVGIAGLIAFARPFESIAPPASVAAHQPVKGDGTGYAWDVAFNALVALFTFGGLNWWAHYGAIHSLDFPSTGQGFCIFCVVLFLCIVAHESGHILAGALCREKLHRVHMGPFKCGLRNGRWRFEFVPREALGGSVAMVPRNMTTYRRDKAIGVAGGPVASLLFGVLCLLPLRGVPDGADGIEWFWFAILATFSLLMFFANLIPKRTRLFYSDGAQLYQVLSNGPWFRVHLAYGMVASSVATRTRPRDWNLDLLKETQAIVREDRDQFLLHLYLCYYFLDRGDSAQAVVEMRAAAGLFRDNFLPRPADFHTDHIFVEAFHARDLNAAEASWAKLQALKKIEFDSSYWRARASLPWFRGDAEGAREAWERGYRLAQKLPPYGVYDFIRDQFLELRKALDAPVEQPAGSTAE